MKKFLFVPVVMILGVLLLSACAPVAGAIANGFVALPDNLKGLIDGLFIAAFALLFDWAIGRLPWLEFLRRYQQEWALGASIAFVTWLQNLLPTGYEDVSIKGVAFVLALIAVFVPYMLARRALAARKVRGFA